MRKKLLFQLSDFNVLPKRFAFTALLTILFTNIFFLTTCGQAQLLKDLNQGPADNDVTEKSLTAASTRMFFTYNNALWRSNGSTSATVKLKTFLSISNLVTQGNTLYFSADDGISGQELWKSNGTPETTVLVKDINPGAGGSFPDHLLNDGGSLYFSADDGNLGRELWFSRGTQTSTVLIKDIQPGQRGSDPAGLTAISGALYFSANDGTNGHELWKSNGTAAGTLMVKDIRPGAYLGSAPEHLTSVNGSLYFVALEGTSGRELWKSNGTGTGTVLVKDIRPGVPWGNVAHLINVNGTLFFSANDGIHGEELWKSDGSSNGTVLVKDMNPGMEGSNEKRWYGEGMGSFTNINGILYFVASVGFPDAIYRSDGTADGTFVIQPAVLTASRTPQPAFTYLNGKVYFLNANSYDEESFMPLYYLWSMPFNGTEPTIVKELVPNDDDNSDGYFHEMIAFGDQVYTFSRFRPQPFENYGSLDFIKSNGTLAGTKIVKDMGESTQGSDPDQMLKINDLIYFRAMPTNYPDTDTYWSLYRTDGTSAGTFPLATMDPGNEMVQVGNKLFFTGFEDFGWALFVTAGTPETTMSLDGSVEGNIPRGLTELQGLLYYYDDYGLLKKSDGSRAGTVTVKTFNRVFSIRNVNGQGFVQAESMTGNLELWKINATGQLSLIKTLGTGNSEPAKYNPTAVVGNVFYFTANDGVHGHEIWRSNGSAAGTFMMFDLNPEDGVDDYGYEDDIRSFTVYNNKLYFSARDNAGVWGWFSVATDHTFAKITDLPPVIYSVVHNDQVYLFPGTDEIVPGTNEEQPLVQFWISDGTAGGTLFITDIEGRGMVDHAIVDDKVYFNTKYGPRMMRSDGTACGTFSIETGVEYAFPMEALGNTMFFGASAPVTGMEPYRYHSINNIPNPGGCAPSARLSSTSSETASLTPYPNPFPDSFTLQIHGKDGERAQVAIFTGSGILVEKLDDIAVNTDHLNIGATWQKGFYIVKVMSGDKVETWHVVKR